MPNKHQSCDLVSSNLVSDFVCLTIFNYYASSEGVQGAQRRLQLRCDISKPPGIREMLASLLLYIPSNTAITFETFTPLILTVTLFVNLIITM